MATIISEISIDVPPELAWSALRDFGAVHERLVPGFVVDARTDGDRARVVTFFNGAVAREVLVGVDDEHRRLAYSVVESALGLSHHNASTEVCADGHGGTRFVWIADVLPDEAAPRVEQLMEHGLGVIKQTLESARV
jgi:Polyketide cyclase / dehydrase and lipid transport